jgi:antitoxin VapB
MSLNIKNADAESLARELAAATGETVTGAVTVALRERLARIGGSRGRSPEQIADGLRRLAQDSSKRWVEPYRSADHGNLLYDEDGLPA